MKRLMLVVWVALCLSGCCLKSVSIRPEMSAVDVRNASVGVVKGDIDFVFKDCCPSKEERKIAISIKRKALILCDRLLAEEISLESYNTHVDAIHKSLSMIVYACANSSQGFTGNKPLSNIPIVTLPAAWENLRHIDETLE